VAKPALRSLLALNLKKQRKILGLSQEKLAEAAGLAWQTVNSIECCRSWVSDATLENLAKALQVDSYELLLPADDARQPPVPEAVFVRQLRQIKRHFDVQFNEALRTLTDR
jgi:transcriptional regulator with XRE-family HTH domain